MSVHVASSQGGVLKVACPAGMSANRDHSGSAEPARLKKQEEVKLLILAACICQITEEQRSQLPTKRKRKGICSRSATADQEIPALITFVEAANVHRSRVLKELLPRQLRATMKP
jgi:hypothetical protein